MMLKRKQKLGAVTIEVAIGIALAVVVLIVALGLFNENLSNMLTGSNIKNMFNNNDKTAYGSFGRDYSASQINVQIMGEQGLSMLRRIANNFAIEQLDQLYSSSDTSIKNYSSIGYLALAINSIVGSPDICVYMKEDSDKKCNDPKIGGYTYTVHLNNGSLMVKKENNTQSPTTNPYKNVTPNSDYASGAFAATIKVPSSGNGDANVINNINPTTAGYNPTSVTPAAIYEYIKDISIKAVDYVYPHVILVNPGTTSSGPDPGSPDIKTLLSNKDPNNAWGYSTNELCTTSEFPYVDYCDNKNPQNAINYITKGAGKTTILNLFTQMLNDVTSSDATDVSPNAKDYALKATYNQFVYNSGDSNSLDGVTKISSSNVAFINKGEVSDINNPGNITCGNAICYNYSFAKGPGNDEFGDSRDWATLMSIYIDQKSIQTIYTNYLNQYMNQH